MYTYFPDEKKMISVFDGATKTLVFYFEREQDFRKEYEPDVFEYFLCKAYLKTYKECIALLPPRNFAVFNRQFFLEYFTQKAKNFTSY